MITLYVIMTTANGMQLMVPGRQIQRFIISGLYRVLTEIAEVHTDIARSILKSLLENLP